MKRQTERLIKEMVRRIVKQFNPEKVILFGSYARGTAGPDSDVDLLVMMHVRGSKRKGIWGQVLQCIRGAMELPPQVLLKFIKQIDILIKNVSLSVLDMEVIRNNQDKRVYRCRIDRKYRMHLAMEGKVITILAVGPHRLQGIG